MPGTIDRFFPLRSELRSEAKNRVRVDAQLGSQYSVTFEPQYGTLIRVRAAGVTTTPAVVV